MVFNRTRNERNYELYVNVFAIRTEQLSSAPGEADETIEVEKHSVHRNTILLVCAAQNIYDAQNRMTFGGDRVHCCGSTTDGQ